MVAIVSGNGLGLEHSSLAVLGVRGMFGEASSGAGGQRTFVNVANGNLVLTARDEFLASRGLDIDYTRTYNSQGQVGAAGSALWLGGVQRQRLDYHGAIPPAGGTLQVSARDGAIASYAWDASRELYVSTAGAGAYDTVHYDGTTGHFIRTDGESGTREIYQAGGAGRLLAEVDRYGNRSEHNYDSAGRLIESRDASGETMRYEYAGDRLTGVSLLPVDGSEQMRVRYHYDDSGRLASVLVDLTPEDGAIEDGRVYRTDYAYEGDSTRLASVLQSDGSRLEFSYVLVGSDWRIASVRDALGQQTSYEYELADRTTHVTDALGVVTVYRYDEAGQLTAVFVPGQTGPGNDRAVTRYGYDGQGNLVGMDDGENQHFSMAYDERGNQVLSCDAMGNSITRVFDQDNLLRSETLFPALDQTDGEHVGAQGDATTSAGTSTALTTRYVYDSNGKGQLRFVISAEGRVTQHLYNPHGERCATVLYTGAFFDVDALAGNMQVDEAGLSAWANAIDPQVTSRTDMAYDSRGLLTSETSWTSLDNSGMGIRDGNETVTRHVYDQSGLLLQSIAGDGGITSYTHDGLGRTVSTRDALGRLSVTTYDDAGGRIIQTTQDGRRSTSVFDRAGRLVSIVSSHLDKSGPASGQETVLGATDYFYDVAGHLFMTRDVTGGRSWALYDDNGRKVADIDAYGALVEYVHDGNGRLILTTRYAKTVDIGSLMDAQGRPLRPDLEQIRPQSSSDDAHTWCTYDASGRLSRSVDANGAVVENFYDAASNLVRSVAHARLLDSSATEINHDPQAVQQCLAAMNLPGDQQADRITRYFHDGDGLLLATLDAEGYLRENIYDGSGLLTATVAYALSTAPASRETGTLEQLRPPVSPFDIVTNRFYDGQRRLIAEVDSEAYVTRNIYSESGRVVVTVRHATALDAQWRERLSQDPGSMTIAGFDGLAGAGDRISMRRVDVLGRVVEQRDADGVVTLFTYGSNDQLVRSERAAGTDEARVALQRYDDFGRLVGELSGVGAALLEGTTSEEGIDDIWARYGVHHRYDAMGRRVASTDQFGATTRYIHDAAGRLVFAVAADGAVTENRYDSFARLASRIQYARPVVMNDGLALSEQDPTVEELTQRVAAIRDEQLDSQTRYTYDQAGRLIATVDAMAYASTRTWNAFGEQTGSSSSTGTGADIIETSSFDRRGQKITSARDVTASNLVTRYAYDAFGRLVRSTAADGSMRSTGYDRNGRAVQLVDGNNAVQSTAYDAFDRVVSRTDALGQVTRYRYADNPRSLTITTPENHSVTTWFNRHGQTLAVSDANDNLSTYRYDASGNLLETTAPLASSNQAYDQAGRLVSSTDANGIVTTLQYDPVGRVITRTVDPHGLNLQTHYRFDARGRQVSVTDANGVTTAFTHDRKGQLTSQAVDPDGLNLRTEFAYDGLGRTLSITSPGGARQIHVYDGLGQRIEEHVDAEGLDLTSRYAYDLAGNMVRSTDANGNVTRHVFDSEGRQLYTIDALGQVSGQRWDAAGQLIETIRYATTVPPDLLNEQPTQQEIEKLLKTSTQQDRKEWRHYDGEGRLLTSMNGLGEVTAYRYDGNGNLLEQRQYANRADLAGWSPGMPQRLPAEDPRHDRRQRSVYDAANRAIYQIDADNGITHQQFDGNGNLLQRTLYGTPLPGTIEPGAAALSLFLASLATQPSGRETAISPDPTPVAADRSERFRYDAAGRLTWHVDAVGAVTQTVRDKSGNPVRLIEYATALAPENEPVLVHSSAQDHISDLGYDSAGRLTWKIDALGQLVRQVLDKNGDTIATVAYGVTVEMPSLTSTPYREQDIAGVLGRALQPDAVRDRITWQTYDGARRKVFTVGAMGAVSENRYDAVGNVVATLAYASPMDVSGLAAMIPGPATRETSTQSPSSFAALILPRLGRDPEADREIRQVYDAGNRVTARSDALGYSSSITYDGLGHVLSTTTGLGGPDVDSQARTERFSWDQQGRLLGSTDALGHTEYYGYDALGNKRSFTNKNGSTWLYDYDAAGRVTQEISPEVALVGLRAGDGSRAAWELESGALAPDSSLSTTASIVTRMAYDVFGDLRSRMEAAGRAEQRTTLYEYDGLGRQVRTVHPLVGVYQQDADALAENGASGLALRHDRMESLYTEVVYDVFGNAIANRDLAGNLSYKVHDSLGRTRHEVDALGYVTSHDYTIWGEAGSLIHHANAIALPITAGTSGKGETFAGFAAAAVDRLAGQLETQTFVSGPARVLSSQYDNMGRLVRTVAPQAFNYDAGGAPGQQTFQAGQTRRYSYDVFGNLVRSESLVNPVSDTWSVTSSWFNRRGEEIASVDALGYLTTRRFNASGQLIEQREYATALPTDVIHGAVRAGRLPQATVVAPDDRTTLFAHDLAGRTIARTRVQVEASDSANGERARVDLVERFAYDALGNQVRSTDASGADTHTYYDALGRVTAIAAALRNGTVDGSMLIPLSTFGRDAYGNVVERIDHAAGAVRADEQGYEPALPDDANDRHTLAVFDSYGRTLRSTDASGADVYSSWNAAGQLAKQWQLVTANDGSSRSLFQAFRYDQLGRQTEVLSAMDQGVSTVTQRYNGYGELVARGRDGADQEYFDYDNAGRLWRSNAAGNPGQAGDVPAVTAAAGGAGADGGVDKVYLYDLAGQVNADIRSGGAGRANIDLKAYGSADQVALLDDVQRIDTRHDLLGRVVQQAGAERIDIQGGVTVRRLYAHAGILASAQPAYDESGRASFSGTNSLGLTWASLAALGSGEVKVVVDYATLAAPLPGGVDEAGNPILVRDESGQVVYGSRSVARSLTRVVTAEQGAGGLRIDWDDAGAADGGIARVTRLQVLKKDVVGNWQPVLDQALFGYAGNSIEVAAPADPSTALVLQLRPAGQTTDPEIGWQAASLVSFGDVARFDASALADGEHEYRVLSLPQGAAARVTASGRLNLSAVPLAVIGTPMEFDVVAPGSLSWQSPDAGITEVLRWRPLAGHGPWQSSPVDRLLVGYPRSVSDLSALPAGDLEVELLWQHAGEDMAFAHATGVVHVTPERPAYQVPQDGYPIITGLRTGETLVGGTVIGFDESGTPIRSGAVAGKILEWPPLDGTPTIFRYRLAGSQTWAQLPVENIGAARDESGGLVFSSDESGQAKGRQYVVIAALAAGEYEYALEQASPSGTDIARHALGVLTVFDAAPGHYETRDVQVQLPRTVTPPAPSGFIIGWTGQGPTYGPPVVIGSDPLGQPVFGPGYGCDVISRDESGNPLAYGPVRAIPHEVWHTELRTQTVPVQVLVSNEPVPLRDESGNVITTPVYETRQGTREEAYQVTIQGEPIVIGTDEAGNPVYALDESGAVLHRVSVETRYRTVTYSYQVQTGSTPVYATDESGNIVRTPVYETRYENREVEVQVATLVTPADPAQFILSEHSGLPIYGFPVVVGQDESGAILYGKGYGVVDGEVRAIPYEELVTVTRPEQVWIEGPTPAPLLRDTTPPYIPGHEVARQPRSWTFSEATREGSGSTSQPTGILSQSRGVDGDTRWLRPVVNQELDRWGNVTALSDVRSAAWVTRYRYNAGNQLIEAFPPSGDGAAAASASSAIFYDRLGRQVATRDGNGNLNGSIWDQGGNLVRELHADGGVLTYRYNAFGDRVASTDAMGNVSTSDYDAMGRLLRITRAAVEVHEVDGANNVHASGTRALSETMAYDQAGRKLWSSNGNGEIVRYSYDPAGNVTSVTQPLGQSSRASFDAAGNKISETDANGYRTGWQYDYFGRLVSRVDLGGATIGYSYDHAGQLVRQTSTRGQDLSFAYDGAGQVVSVTDAALGQVTSYQYDLAGRHVREKTVQGGVVYQDNHLAYDALGRLRTVSDGSVHIAIDYDRAGNRQRISSHVINAADRSQDGIRYFAYDRMNRQIVVDAVDAAGNINATQGNRITYDLNGNRSSDTSWGNHVSAIEVVDHYELRDVPVQIGVDEDNQPVFGLTESSVPIYRTEYVAAQGESTEVYRYDALDRLASVSRNGVLVDRRRYDAASRVVSSGPEGSLPTAYVDALNGITSTGQTAAGNGSETRINRYDGNGRLLHQRVLKSDNSAKFDIDYGSYDAAGNLLAYTLQNHDGEAYTNTYLYTSERFDGYSEARIDASSSRFEAGSTVQGYDVNGYLTSVTDATSPASNRRFVNDAAGRALYVEQGGRVLRQIIVNGEVLGSHGQAVDPADPVHQDGQPNFVDAADFNFGYRSVAGNYPQAAPGIHVVAAGDTLAGIARVEYGDSQLWYVIASANGLRGDADLRVGQALSIPSRVATVHNASDTFRPYDPSRAVGDTTPNLPVPAQGDSSSGGCGGVGTILVAVVAVAVAAASGQWWLQSVVGPLESAAASASTATMTSASLTAGTGASVGAATTLSSIYGAGNVVIAGAISGALGAVASQVAGKGLGIGGGFNWKDVALSAIGGGLASGLTILEALPANTLASASLRGALTNAATQGIAVVAGLQRSFNWRSVAAAAISAGVSVGTASALESPGGAVKPTAGFGMDMAGVFTRSISTVAGGLASASLRGGRIDITQIVSDSFGNALGEHLANANLASTASGSAALAALTATDEDQVPNYWDTHPMMYASADMQGLSLLQLAGGITNAIDDGRWSRVNVPVEEDLSSKAATGAGMLGRSEMENSARHVAADFADLPQGIPDLNEWSIVGRHEGKPVLTAPEVEVVASAWSLDGDERLFSSSSHFEPGFVRGLNGGDPYHTRFDPPLSAAENFGLVINGGLNVLTDIVKQPLAEIADIARIGYQLGKSVLGYGRETIIPYSAAGQAGASGMSLAQYASETVDGFLNLGVDLTVSATEGHWNDFGGQLIGVAGITRGFKTSKAGLGTTLVATEKSLLTGVPVNGASRSIPLGFRNEEQFLAAAQHLQSVLEKSGVTDATIGVRGSSVTGYSLTKGTPFRARSDIDFFIESGQLTQGFVTSRNIAGFVHPEKIMRRYPLLKEWSETWAGNLGRDVTPGAFVPGKLSVQPAIIMKPLKK